MVKEKPLSAARESFTHDDLRDSRSLPGLLKYCVRHDKLLTYPRHTMPNYTHLTRTSTL